MPVSLTAIARLHVALERALLVEPGVGGLDHQPPAAGHGIARVDTEVEQRVLELVRVAQRRPEPVGQHRLQLDRGAHGAPDEILHLRDQRVRTGRPRVQRLPAGEGEQPVRERGGP
ncbi:hypothetical protein, partial [Chitinimonas prasina]|uniref:hypothetical protein n=1 Tax=Chitinimonas prasina TaxID=1434937 RepID=UPI0027E4C840